MRSRVFWMVLVVVVLLIWSLSSQFGTGASPISFSEFIRWVDTGQVDHCTSSDQVGHFGAVA